MPETDFSVKIDPFLLIHFTDVLDRQQNPSKRCLSVPVAKADDLQRSGDAAMKSLRRSGEHFTAF